MMSNSSSRYFATFGKNVSDVTIGVPTETFTNEKRVALSPEATSRLIKLGFKVNIQKGAGEASAFKDDEYSKVGANLVSLDQAIKSDLILKVRPPSEAEAKAL